MGQFDNALEPIKTAIQMYRDQGKVPRENWLLLLRVIYWELERLPNMLVILKELIEEYPKDTYVLTLAGVYSELGDTKKQLALTEALYEKGYIDGKTTRRQSRKPVLATWHSLQGGSNSEKEIAAST